MLIVASANRLDETKNNTKATKHTRMMIETKLWLGPRVRLRLRLTPRLRSRLRLRLRPNTKP